jgi:N-acetylglucosamine kinase-like BadF-type ATPase
MGNGVHRRACRQPAVQNSMSDFFLGLDGGQSNTTALIGDARGNIVGWGSAGPCNHVQAAEAQEKFLAVMRDCLSQAAARAGMEGWHFKAACMGMSGGPDDKAALLHELVEAEHTVVTHDAMIALAGATSGEPGIIVIAGTGSMAFGQNARGETARAGGWGYIFGDEGSGFDIAKQAVRAVLREHEGWGARTALTPALLEASSSRDANEMLLLFYRDSWTRSRVADLARTVDRVAEEGDPIAVRVVQQAAQELALLAGSVRRQLWSEGESAIISWAGGAFQSTVLVERFRLLIALEKEAVCQSPQHGPAAGALLLAYKAAGLDVRPGSIKTRQDGSAENPQE